MDLRESRLTIDDGDDRVGNSNIWEKSILTNLSYLGEVYRSWSNMGHESNLFLYPYLGCVYCSTTACVLSETSCERD